MRSSISKKNKKSLRLPIALNSRTPSCTFELSQGLHVACSFALRPGKHPVQLCFFRPGWRFGVCTELPANTLLGPFHLPGPSEVSVSPALVSGPLICWMSDEGEDLHAGTFVTCLRFLHSRSPCTV